jgi:hypothetical protein
MAMGPGYHRTSESNLAGIAAQESGAAPVVTSAGALVKTLGELNLRRIAVLTPYMKPLTSMVTDYIAAEGFTVQSVHSLEISDNLAVGRRDPFAAIEAAGVLDLAGADQHGRGRAQHSPGLSQRRAGAAAQSGGVLLQDHGALGGALYLHRIAHRQCNH